MSSVWISQLWMGWDDVSDSITVEIWRLPAQAKIKLFAWLAWRDRLLTNVAKKMPEM